MMQQPTATRNAAEPHEARPRGAGAGLGAAAVGGGLGLALPAVARVHELLAGASPPAGHLVAAGALGGVAISTFTRREEGGGHRATAVGFAVVALLAVGLGAPVLLARADGVAASLVAVALAAILGLVGGRAARLDGLAALAGAGVGTLVAGGLLLPWMGPGGCAVAAALAGLAAAAAPAGRAPESRDAAPWPALALAGAGTTLVLFPAAWLALGTLPWPSAAPPTLAALALGGLAAGAFLASRGSDSTLPAAGAVLLLAAALLALLLRGPGWALVQATVDNSWLPSVSPLGGALAIAVLGLVATLLPGLGLGLTAGPLAGRPARLAAAMAGGAVGVLLARVLCSLAGGTVAGLAGVALVGAGLALRGGERGPARLAGAGVAAAAVVLAVVAALGAWGTRPLAPTLEVVARADSALGRLVTAREGDDALVLGRGGVLARAGVGADVPPPDDVLAGHLAALVPAVPRRVLVVGSPSPAVSKAVATHDGVEVVRVTSSTAVTEALHAALPGEAGVGEAAAAAASPAALSRRPEAERPFDAVVLTIDDPTWPGAGAWFSRDGYRALGELVAPGGVLVRRLSIDRLGPEGLARAVLAQAEAFPSTHVLTADQGRDGTVLALSIRTAADTATGASAEEGDGTGDVDPAGTPSGAAAPPGGSATPGSDRPLIDDVAGRLPWRRLVIDERLNPAMTDAVREDLGRALLVQRDDLLETFAGGAPEVRAAHDLPPIDPWSPGASAWRLPAPELAARELARAMLYARIATVDLPLVLDSSAVVADEDGSDAEPGWRRWPFLGLDERLGPAWSSPGGTLRYLNRYTEFRGTRGLYRESSRRQRFERDGATLTIRAVPRSRATANTLIASIESLRGPDSDVRRRGRTAIVGRPALWEFEEPTPGRHLIRLTWHCPGQNRLFAAELDRSDAQPGRYEATLEELLADFRCAPPDA